MGNLLQCRKTEVEPKIRKVIKEDFWEEVGLALRNTARLKGKGGTGEKKYQYVRFFSQSQRRDNQTQSWKKHSWNPCSRVQRLTEASASIRGVMHPSTGMLGVCGNMEWSQVWASLNDTAGGGTLSKLCHFPELQMPYLWNVATIPAPYGCCRNNLFQVPRLVPGT